MANIKYIHHVGKTFIICETWRWHTCNIQVTCRKSHLKESGRQVEQIRLRSTKSMVIIIFRHEIFNSLLANFRSNYDNDTFRYFAWTFFDNQTHPITRSKRIQGDRTRNTEHAAPLLASLMELVSNCNLMSTLYRVGNTAARSRNHFWL